MLTKKLNIGLNIGFTKKLNIGLNKAKQGSANQLKLFEMNEF